MGTTISNGLGIQFWKEGEASYNESLEQEVGVNGEPFYAPHNADDPERIQIHDTSDIPQRDYRLQIYDQDGILVDTLSFTHQLVSGDHVYDLQFKFETLGLTNGLYKLKIISVELLMSGGVTNPLQEPSGTLTFFLAEFEISGGVENLMQEVGGNIQGTYFTGAFKLGNDSEDVCEEIEENLYSDVPFAIGVIMYLDTLLTSPVTGFSYIVHEGVVYNLNSVTGEVGTGTAFCM